jgi:CBS domain-containing protein
VNPCKIGGVLSFANPRNGYGPVDFARWRVQDAGRRRFVFMTPSAAGIDLNESVKHLLAEKGEGVSSISPDATVYDAVALLSEKRIGSLLVLSEGRLVGIITERDYARKVILKGRHSRETRVGEIMTTPVLCITPEHSVGQCMHLMTSRRIRHLPVVADERVVGLLSIGDIINWMINSQKETIRHLTNYITGSYPA